MSLRHVILDRDGVLNREDPDGGYVTDPSDWRWESGALEALERLAAAGLVLSVVTNQSVIGRGGATRAQVGAVLARMVREAEAVGARFASVQLCPHAPDEGCACRKPNPGMLHAAVEASGLPASEAVFIGDSATDLEAARAAGVGPVLVRTGKGAATEARGAQGDAPVFDSLGAFASAVLGEP